MCADEWGTPIWLMAIKQSSKCAQQTRYAPRITLFADTANSLDEINYAKKSHKFNIDFASICRSRRGSKHVFHRRTHPRRCVCIGRLPDFPCLWHARTDWLCLFIVCESLWMISTATPRSWQHCPTTRYRSNTRKRAVARRALPVCICARVVWHVGCTLFI